MLPIHYNRAGGGGGGGGAEEEEDERKYVDCAVVVDENGGGGECPPGVGSHARFIGRDLSRPHPLVPPLISDLVAQPVSQPKNGTDGHRDQPQLGHKRRGRKKREARG